MSEGRWGHLVVKIFGVWNDTLDIFKQLETVGILSNRNLARVPNSWKEEAIIIFAS